MVNLNDEIAVTSMGDVTPENTIVSNKATVNWDGNPIGICDIADVTILPAATLSIIKTVEPNEVTSGVPIPVIFTIIIQNTGLTTATGVVITDEVPFVFKLATVCSSAGKVKLNLRTNSFTVDCINIDPSDQVTVTVNTNYIDL
jgi:uncharacterized repeat protein (TIGR01451 family)